MKVIAKPRRCGKTTELIKLSNEHWHYIVCSDRQRVQSTAQLAQELEVDIPFPITMEEFVQGRFCAAQGPTGPGIRGFLLDDIQDWLRRFAREVPITAIAVTVEEEND